MERFEVARLFHIDPTALRHIPLSEYRKRRAYWLEVRQITSGVKQGPGGVVIEESAWKPEGDAIIIE